jgi:hypothetical protein
MFHGAKTTIVILVLERTSLKAGETTLTCQKSDNLITLSAAFLWNQTAIFSQSSDLQPLFYYQKEIE